MASNQLFDELAATCFRWVFSPGRGGPKPSGWDTEKATSFERTCLREGIHVESASFRDDTTDTTAWALRFCHPDRDDDTIQWCCEIGILSRNGGKPWFSCSLGVTRVGAMLAPVKKVVTRPNIVLDILGRFKCMGGYRLTSKPTQMSSRQADLDTFMRVLQSSERTHPLIFVSALNSTNEPLVSADTIANQVAGLAHVIVATDSSVPDLLFDRMPPMLRAYNGAVRLYWPGFRLTDHHFNHPLWTTEKLEFYSDSSTRIARILLGSICASAVFNLNDNVLNWDGLQALIRSKAIEDAKAKGNNDELLLLFEAENRALTSETEQLKRDFAAQGEEVKKLRTLTELYRTSLNERKTAASATSAPSPAENVEEALDRAINRHASRLAFSPNSKSEHEGSPFEEAHEVEAALDWLGTTYWEARSGVKSCADLDESFRQAVSGWDYSGGQSDLTMKRYKDWYQCPWKNGKVWIDEHMRCGGPNRNPNQSIRIAFHWDKVEEKVVIGYIGQHQKTSES